MNFYPWRNNAARFTVIINNIKNILGQKLETLKHLLNKLSTKQTRTRSLEQLHNGSVHTQSGRLWSPCTQCTDKKY